MPDVVKLLSHGLMSASLTNPKFYEIFPEFLTLRNKLQALQVDLSGKHGCSGCAKRRVEANLFPDFVAVFNTLAPDRVQAFKAHVGATKLLINRVNPMSNQFESKVV